MAGHAVEIPGHKPGRYKGYDGKDDDRTHDLPYVSEPAASDHQTASTVLMAVPAVVSTRRDGKWAVKANRRI
jgi:hypothetical protein